MINSCKNNCSLLINYSKIVVHWVCGSNCPNNSCSPLIANCKYLLNQLPWVKLKHCYKKTNQCADAHVRHRAGTMEDFVVYNSSVGDYNKMYSFYHNLSKYQVIIGEFT